MEKSDMLVRNIYQIDNQQIIKDIIQGLIPNIQTQQPNTILTQQGKECSLRHITTLHLRVQRLYAAMEHIVLAEAAEVRVHIMEE